MGHFIAWFFYAFLGLIFGLLPVGIMTLRLLHLKNKKTLPLSLMPQGLIAVKQYQSAYIVMGVQFAYSLFFTALLTHPVSIFSFIVGAQIRGVRPLRTQLNMIPVLAFLVGQSSSAFVLIVGFMAMMFYKPEHFKTASCTILALSPIWLTLAVSSTAGMLSLGLSIVLLYLHKQELLGLN